VFSGTVEAIDPVIDPNSRSVKLRAQIPNPDGRLRPGQFAQLQLDTGGAAGEGVLVPEQALLQDGNVRYVYTVVDGKAHRVEVRTGLRVPGKVQVTEGLKAGDVVITSGQTKPIMHEGLAVQVMPAGGAQGGPQGAPKQAQQQAPKQAPKQAQPPAAPESPEASNERAADSR
jgi:membrane fusion protein (multidrug efflux system)